MEHVCYRCGQPVEEGLAFCENCKAPQIRVELASENAAATEPIRPGIPGDMQPPARPVELTGTSRPYVSAPRPFLWRDAFPGAILAGGVVGLSWMIPPIGFLLWPLTAGVLGVIFYKRRVPDAVITKGVGARVGAITGVFGFLIFAVLAGLSMLVAGREKFHEQLNIAFQQAAARNPDPQMQATMQSFMTPGGIALMFVFGSLFFLVMFVGFSSLGGYLGAKLMTSRRK